MAAKLAFFASLPPSLRPRAIFLAVALPNEPTVPFSFIRSAACSIHLGSSAISIPCLRASRLRLQRFRSQRLNTLLVRCSNLGRADIHAERAGTANLGRIRLGRTELLGLRLNRRATIDLEHGHN